jgi:membrane protein YqaA with SNARE-associated domain
VAAVRAGAWRSRLVGALALVALTGLAVAAWQAARALLDAAVAETLGYAGIFLLTTACSATLFLPAPAFGAVGIAGGALNPLLVGLAAGLGAATGELTGYYAGRSGRAVVGGRGAAIAARLRGWMLRHGFVALVALAAIPNPLFDAAGLTAGSLGYPPARYWLAVALGKSITYAIIATVGYALAAP